MSLTTPIHLDAGLLTFPEISYWENFAWGVLGGGLGELLRWFNRREKAKLPKHFGSWRYWLLTIAMFLSGGLLVVAYMRSNIQIIPILAINVGASTPLLIQSLIAQTPEILPGSEG